MLTAKVIDIKRMAVHDGPGIRTTAFLKGCSLKCLWCHNPEGIGFEPQLAYYGEKCINCGECASVCSAGAHVMTQKGHIFDRTCCVGCGSCEEVCLGSALKFYGKTMSVEELSSILLEDRLFYEHSGGGITLSGGEALLQTEFCVELLQKMKAEGIHTAVDTCGNIPREKLDKVIPYTDIFLYDIKAIDEETHIRCTGHSNQLILENLSYLDQCGAQVEIRIPYVPGYNSDQIDKIAKYIKDFHNIARVRVLPYHNYAGSKYTALEMNNTLPAKLPDEEEIAKAQAKFN